jgi:pimeloyl-ACP methyl ester carboxylesterase
MAQIVFLHGLESHVDEARVPIGAKATFLKTRHGAHTPALDTRDAVAIANALRAEGKAFKYPHPQYEEAFKTPLQNARAALAPDTRLVIGSSFGGAVLLRLVHETKDWKIPCIFLAGAGPKLTPHKSLPLDLKCLLIHGRDDDVVPFADSEMLASSSPGAELWEVPGGHRMDFIVEGEGEKESILARAIAKML